MKRTSLTIALIVLAVAMGAGAGPAAGSHEEEPDTEPFQRAFFGVYEKVRIYDPQSQVCTVSRGNVEFEGARWPSWAHLYRVNLVLHPGQDASSNVLDRCKTYYPVVDSCLLEGRPHWELSGFCDSGGNITMKVWPRENATFYYRNLLGARYTAQMMTSFVVCVNTNYQPFLGAGYCGEDVDEIPGEGPGSGH